MGKNGGEDTYVHLIGGGMGGTLGAIVTCPLEVVKTRLQSSNSGFDNQPRSSGGGGASATTTGIKPGPATPSTMNATNDVRGNTNSSHNQMSSSKNFETRTKIVTAKKQNLNLLQSSNFRSSKTLEIPDFGTVQQHRGLTAKTISWRSALNRGLNNIYTKSNSILSHNISKTQHYQQPRSPMLNFYGRFYSSAAAAAPGPPPFKGGGGSTALGVFECISHIIRHEGVRGLFRGLGPNLVGVAPSRAIYFYTYQTGKRWVNGQMPKANRDTPFVHVMSALMAGFSSSTITNPIWLVKTRLQLDRTTGNSGLTVVKCIKGIHKEKGIFGFWKGVTASYWGISETMIHFVIYEFLKKQLAERQKLRQTSGQNEKDLWHFAGYMACGACSKFTATCLAYPHEVARTRMREEGGKYRSFWQSLAVVFREEGRSGLYRGLTTQLLRQIPNTAIMMSTYEATVYLLTRNRN